MKKLTRPPKRIDIPLPSEQIKFLSVLAEKKVTGYDRPEGMSGPELAAALGEDRESQSYAGIYYMMARLEKAGLVKGVAVVVEHGPYKTRQKYFQITDKGVNAFRESIEVYLKAAERSRLEFAWSGGSA